jgi:thiamine transport system substrate-binding protein
MRIGVAGVLAALIVAACSSSSSTATTAGGGTAKPPAGTTITLVSHDSYAVSKSVLAAFTKQTGIHVRILKSGDAGAALNQVILTKDHPLGDAFFGVDNTLLARALAAGVFVPTDPAALGSVPKEFQLDPSHDLVPIDYGDVCVNYDRAYFGTHHLAVPTTFDDLADPRYKGLLEVENPAVSSPGLVFLLATVKHYGPANYLDYWKRLKANGVEVADGWDAAYYTAFSGSSGKGPRPLVVSYGSSPPAEVPPHTKPGVGPTGIMTATCFRQIEFAGVLKGAAHPQQAAAFVAFMLSRAFQADMPMQMYVYPVVPNVPLPAAFTKYAVIPKVSATLPPADIKANSQRWIDAWTTAVLS